MFSIEAALFKERFKPKPLVGFSLFYFLMIVSQLFLGNPDQSIIFFPALATVYGSILWVFVFDDGKIMSYRRLLPSLPLGRGGIYRSFLFMRLLLWVCGCILAFALSFASSFFFEVQLDLPIVFFGLGISFMIFNLSLLILQGSPVFAIGFLGALTGLSMGLLFSATRTLIQWIQGLGLWGSKFLVLCLGCGFLLMLSNGFFYLRRRP